MKYVSAWKKRILPCLLLAVLLFCGCAKVSMDTMSMEMSAPDIEAHMENASAMDADILSMTSSDFGGHKVIQTYELSFETEYFDEDIDYIMQKVAAAGGYAETSNLSGKKPETYQERGRNAYLVLRIPSKNVGSFFEDMKKSVGTLLSADQNAQNITEQYFDTETRLEVLKTQHERLTNILVKTDNLADIIELENEIARITLEIESLTTELRRWDNLIDYSTVTIHLSELALQQGPADVKSVGERMSTGFQSTLAGIGVFFENLLVFLVCASPVLVPLAVITVVIILLVRKKRAAKAAAREQSEKKPDNLS